MPPWSPTPTQGNDDLVVARVADTPIYASELRRQQERTGDDARTALDTLIAEELLARHARERGIQPDSELRLAIKRALVDKLLATQFEPETTLDKMPDEDVRPLYERARKAYVHPDVFEVGVITLSALPAHGQARREAARAQARELEQRLRTRARWSVEDFKELINDPAFKSDLTVYSRLIQDADGPFSGEVARAIRKLKAQGALTPVMENERGFHVAICINIIAAKNISFQEARAELAEAYYPRWRSERFARLADQAAQHFGIWLNPETNRNDD